VLNTKPSTKPSSADLDRELMLLREKAKSMMARESSPVSDTAKRFRYDR
jgi:hypothetical protein